MNTVPSTSRSRWQKLWRYAQLYGWRRALIKAAGRTRRGSRWVLGWRRRNGAQAISFVGCGQAAFSTLCYFVYRARGPVFLDAYDIDADQAKSLAQAYMFRAVANGAEALFQNPDCRLVYIASNHASHAQYAIAALQNGRDVFIEKPVCTKWSDLEALEACITQSSRRVCAGFNRPFSAAIRELRAAVSGLRSPLTMACFIHGHRIPADHWYRAPDEGTRISGNAGHWLDLAVHLLTAVWGAPPSSIHLNHTPALVAEPDDNFSLTLHTDNGDLITIILSSRNEPTEGVRETIEIQCGDVSAQIDDFRAMRMWRGGASIQRRYQPKDVGHRLCTLQPFLPAAQQRDWTEVVYSTRLMLHATDLARRGGGTATADLARTAAPASFDPE